MQKKTRNKKSSRLKNERIFVIVTIKRVLYQSELYFIPTDVVQDKDEK